VVLYIEVIEGLASLRMYLVVPFEKVLFNHCMIYFAIVGKELTKRVQGFGELGG
jgi:hypothetical protein